MILRYTPLLASRLRLFVGLLFVTAATNAQLTNAGGTITISNGASIVCQGSVTNTSGTITNDGKLEVRGSFINGGTYNSTANEDSLLLTDTGSVILNPGTSTLNYLGINKTSGGKVTLAASTTINTKFDLLGGGFSTDPLTAFELIAPSTATFSFAAGTEIIGKVRRTGWSNETAAAFNNPNMMLTTHGGTSPAGMMVSMVPGGDPTGAEREVKRYFYFSPTGGSGYTADLTLPYTAAELNTNTEGNLVPWYYASGEWRAKFTGSTLNTAADYVTTTGVPADSLVSTEWKLADPRYTFNVATYLRGAWNSGTQTLSTALNSAGLLPLSQPYNTTPFNYNGTESVASIPNANIVDWVLLELRKPATADASLATSATIIGRKAAFLTNTGSIVDLDGVTPAAFNIIKQGTSFVVVRHRNHLAVMSNAIPSNSIGTFANDFGALANVYKNPSASSDPETALAGGSKYGLWAGDANKGNSVNAIDINNVKTAVSILLSGYQFQDVDLNGAVNSLDITRAKSTISTLGSSSASNRSSSSDPAVKGITTHVPD